MEENIYDFTPKPEQKTMVISEEDKALITSSCKWARFLAILSFVMIGIAVLGYLMLLLGVGVAGIAIPGLTDPAFVTAMTVVVIFALLVMLVYFLPTFYLYRYANSGLKAVEADDSQAMTDSFYNIKRYFKFIGIFTIVVIALYILMFIIMFIAGFAGASRMYGM